MAQTQHMGMGRCICPFTDFMSNHAPMEQHPPYVEPEGEVTALPQKEHGDRQRPHESEDAERQTAVARGRLARQLTLPQTSQLPLPERQNNDLINPAFTALCDNVRDYAIFVLNAEGIIVYWGTGAHLLKWWTKEEAEGAHLRLLYPEGGSEDGTAEDHLRESAETGEYVGEGQRVRRGGSTFWAHVSLTALRDPSGKLLGFAKVTRDMTERRAIEAAVALSHEAQTTRDAALASAQEAELARSRAEEARLRAELARERSEEAAEFAREQARGAQSYISNVLLPELASEKAERAALGTEVNAYVQMQAHAREEERNANKS